MRWYKYLSVLTLSLLFSLSVVAQDVFTVFPAALKSGNITAISKNFDKRIDITIDDNSDNYSKDQAEVILKDFLSKFSTREFTVIHKGASPNGAQYVVGNLKTNKGAYRTYIYVKNTDGVNYVQEIRFEKE